MASRRLGGRVRHATPLVKSRNPAQICLELSDHSIVRKSATDFFNLRGLREPASQASRLSEQFERINRAHLSTLQVRIDREYDGSDVLLTLHANSAVGAIPLLSPITGASDYGLVVQPRFPWSGIGPMLSEMGWRVAPIPLRLPVLKRSERRVPAWVLSVMILVRLSKLLDSLDRRFEVVEEIIGAPRGAVRWADYAMHSLATGNLLAVPCVFRDLRDDRILKGTIRFALEKHLRALQTQRTSGAFVHRLIEFCEHLLRGVASVQSIMPSSTTVAGWLRRPMRTEAVMNGLQAIEWTIEDRGLAGLSDLEGIPWTMPMDEFFEAWIETVLQIVARKTGAAMKVGRKHETVHAIAWDPPYLGSQKSLRPDFRLEWEGTTLIIDAKYKRHWEELQRESWYNINDILKEQHRTDLFQVLAYANLSQSARTIACLAYPCSPQTWEWLRAQGRLFHRAEISVESRSVRLWLTAIPMTLSAEQIAQRFAEELRSESYR